MQALYSFLATGQAALVVLLIVLLEGGILLMRHLQDSASRPDLLAWLSPLGAGLALVAALWLAQTDADPRLLGVALTIAGIAHLAGYRQRWYS